MKSYERTQNAMFDPCFPCNSIPFAIALSELVRDKGTDAIKSDEAKQILWVLMAQAYGQLAEIDLCAEWSRLNTAQQDRSETHD